MPAEPAVAETLYFEHAGSELRRGLNLIRLAALLRRQPLSLRSGFSIAPLRPALGGAACRHAGAHRLGLGPQRLADHQSRHRPQPFSRSSGRLAARADGGDERAVAVDRAGFAAARMRRSRPSPKNSRATRGHGSCSASALRIPTRIGRTQHWTEFLTRLRGGRAERCSWSAAKRTCARARFHCAAAPAPPPSTPAISTLIEAAGLLAPCRSLRRPEFRPDESRRRRRHRCVRAVRLDAGLDLFEIHPCHRAGRRSGARRHARGFHPRRY